MGTAQRLRDVGSQANWAAGVRLCSFLGESAEGTQGVRWGAGTRARLDRWQPLGCYCFGFKGCPAGLASYGGLGQARGHRPFGGRPDACTSFMEDTLLRDRVIRARSPF